MEFLIDWLISFKKKKKYFVNKSNSFKDKLKHKYPLLFFFKIIFLICHSFRVLMWLIYMTEVLVMVINVE